MKLNSDIAFEMLEKLTTRAHLLRRQCELVKQDQNEFYKENCNNVCVLSELRKGTNGKCFLISEYGPKRILIEIPTELVDEECDDVAISKAKQYFKNYFAQKSVGNDLFKIESIIEKIRFLPLDIAHELIDGLVKLKDLNHNNKNAFGYVFTRDDQKELTNSLKSTLDKNYGVS